MNHHLRNELIALSINEELSPELREAIRRELGDRPLDTMALSQSGEG